MPTDREILEELDAQCDKLVKDYPESNAHVGSIRVDLCGAIAQIDRPQKSSKQLTKDVIKDAEQRISAFVTFYKNGPDTERKQA